MRWHNLDWLISWKGPLLWIILIVAALIPINSLVDPIKFILLLLIIVLMPPAIVIAGIVKGVEKVRGGLGFMVAMVVLEFLGIGSWIGHILFGLGLPFLVFAFLFAGLMTKILDRMLRPKKKRAKLNFETIMQSRLWWLFLVMMWSIVVVSPTAPVAVGAAIFLFTIAITVVIPVLKLFARSRLSTEREYTTNAGKHRKRISS